MVLEIMLVLGDQAQESHRFAMISLWKKIERAKPVDPIGSFERLDISRLGVDITTDVDDLLGFEVEQLL